jgi:UDPglucose 6-dehydrogenase
LTSARSAELIKHASNGFLAAKISYINAVAQLAEAVGANIDEVSAGMGSDPRIGGDFLRAGVGYGGSCLPKDVAAFEAVAKRYGVHFPLLHEIARLNEEQRARFVEKIKQSMGPLAGKRIAALGLSFKEETDDVRESPAIAIVRELVQCGASVCAHDPAAMEKAQTILAGGQITYAQDAYDAACGCDALLILTAWKQFGKLDLHRLHSVMKSPVIFDGRNMFLPEEMAAAGFVYHSVGRRSLPLYCPPVLFKLQNPRASKSGLSGTPMPTQSAHVGVGSTAASPLLCK